MSHDKTYIGREVAESRRRTGIGGVDQQWSQAHILGKNVTHLSICVRVGIPRWSSSRTLLRWGINCAIGIANPLLGEIYDAGSIWDMSGLKKERTTIVEHEVECQYHVEHDGECAARIQRKCVEKPIERTE